jgi:prophage regulatory protein
MKAISIAAGAGEKNQNPSAMSDLTSKSSNICLYRLPQVLARIPVSKSSWFAGIQAGRFPRGLQLGPRTTVWRSDDIDSLIKNLGVVA